MGFADIRRHRMRAYFLPLVAGGLLALSAFLLRDDPKVPPEFTNVERQPERRRLKFVSDHAPWSAWLALVLIVCAIGAMVAFVFKRHRLIALIAYGVALVIVLEKI